MPQGVKRQYVELVDDKKLTRVQLKQLQNYLALMTLVAPLASRGFNAIACGDDKVLDEVFHDLDALKKRIRRK